MDRYYLPEGKFYVGSICPNCQRTFDLNDGKFETLRLANGQDARILFCGKCTIDSIRVTNEIASGRVKLKMMRLEEEE